MPGDFHEASLLDSTPDYTAIDGLPHF